MVCYFEKGKFVGATFVDLQKAFDCIPHEMLLQKLQYYNFANCSIRLIENFLKNKKQYVHLNGAYSEEGDVVLRAPQGSVMGPVPF